MAHHIYSVIGFMSVTGRSCKRSTLDHGPRMFLLAGAGGEGTCSATELERFR